MARRARSVECIRLLELKDVLASKFWGCCSARAPYARRHMHSPQSAQRLLTKASNSRQRPRKCSAEVANDSCGTGYLEAYAWIAPSVVFLPSEDIRVHRN